MFKQNLDNVKGHLDITLNCLILYPHGYIFSDFHTDPETNIPMMEITIFPTYTVSVQV